MVLESDKPKRFFYHFRKMDGRMSVHFADACTPCEDVVCKVPCETKRNKRQPRLVMRGFARKVTVRDGVATIE